MARAKTEKPEPKLCKCRQHPIITKRRGGGTMISCPEPLKCDGNFRTPWFPSEEQAVIYWNGMDMKKMVNGGK